MIATLNKAEGRGKQKQKTIKWMTLEVYFSTSNPGLPFSMDHFVTHTPYQSLTCILQTPNSCWKKNVTLLTSVF